MDDLLGNKPFIEPVATLSSTGAATSKSTTHKIHDTTAQNMKSSEHCF